jgi:phage terminase large subunit GpA-like protein
MRWDAEDGSDARYLCDTCQAEITDEQRREMVRNGEWRAEFPERTVRGYHLNGLASLFRHKKGYTNRLHQMAAEHIAAKKKGKETLKTWVNTFLAETWEEEGETLSHETLMLRRHEWRDFPEGGLLVTAGADVQGDRVEVEFVAWGEGEESWSIGYEVIIGDFNRESVQDTLDDLLKRTWTHPSGVEIRVSAAAIDSGHKSKAVYGFCRRREMRRVFAVKGRGGPALPILSRPNRRGIEKALLFTVGTDAAKEVIFSRLLEGTAGPGYMHIPADRSEDWCRQMVAEKKVTRYRDGVPFSKFENPGKARNEALDCRVYALAALSMLRVNWDRLKASFDKSAAARKAEAQSAAKEPPAAGAIKRSRPPRGGWVQNW